MVGTLSFTDFLVLRHWDAFHPLVSPPEVIGEETLDQLGSELKDLVMMGPFSWEAIGNIVGFFFMVCLLVFCMPFGAIDTVRYSIAGSISRRLERLASLEVRRIRRPRGRHPHPSVGGTLLGMVVQR